MTPTEASLIQVLTKGLKLQRTAPITPQTAITRNPAPTGAAGGEAGAGGRDTLGLDSVDILEIAVLLDKHFSVSLEEDDAQVHQALTNISTLAAYIDHHRPQ